MLSLATSAHPHHATISAWKPGESKAHRANFPVDAIAAGRFALTSICYLAPTALVIASLAIPLAATRLYLDGVSVDQAFRTQFLTRMADQLGWNDMAYKPTQFLSRVVVLYGRLVR